MRLRINQREDVVLTRCGKFTVPVGFAEAGANAVDFFGGLQVGKGNLIGADTDKRAWILFRHCLMIQQATWCEEDRPYFLFSESRYCILCPVKV